jgi:predicted RNase H-like HicB family nuclease/predicted RNA binding protein YcfA (HicA-like mRNA interferase family)
MYSALPYPENIKPLLSDIYQMNLKVVIVKDPEDGGFIVSCPALPGCHSEGETIEEALQNIRDAIHGCLAVLNERAQQTRGARVMEISV